MDRVISIVRKTLSDTIDAIDGQIIMTPDILLAIDAMAIGKVPLYWIYDPSGAEISWLLPNLGTWFNDLILRNRELNDWLNKGRPKEFWLGGFFNPQGFLTAMKQEVSRSKPRVDPSKTDKDKPDTSKDYSLDNVVYQATPKDFNFDTSKAHEVEGVYIHGLFLQGAKWTK